MIWGAGRMTKLLAAQGELEAQFAILAESIKFSTSYTFKCVRWFGQSRHARPRFSRFSASRRIVYFYSRCMDDQYYWPFKRSAQMICTILPAVTPCWIL